MKFEKIVEGTYSLGGSIKLEFHGFYNDVYKLEVIRESDWLSNLFSKKRNRSIYLNEIKINKNKDKLQELRSAIIDYLERNPLIREELEELPNVKDDMTWNPEWPEFSLTKGLTSYSLLAKWFLDRIDKKTYIRPQWVDDALKEIAENRKQGKYKEIEVTDEEAEAFMKQLQETGQATHTFKEDK